MNVIQETNPGGNIGSAFGTGLGSGIQALANNKLQQIQQQQQTAKAAQFWTGLGLDPQMAHQFASAPEAIQKSLLDRLEGVNLGGQQSGREGSINIGANPAERRHKELIDLKRESLAEKRKLTEHQEEVAGQEKVQPFLHAQAQDFNNAKKIQNMATRMLANLEKNKEKWPNLAGYLPDRIHRNPEVRKYLADANQLVTLLAGSRKGQPTNFKIKLEALSKPQLDQPIETQEAILKDLISSSGEVFNTQKEIAKIKEANGGNYPRDLETRLAEMQNTRTEQQPEQLSVGSTVEKLPDASLYPNAEIEAPNGEILVSDGKKWKKKGK